MKWHSIARPLLLGLAVATLFLLLLEGGARLLPLNRWEQERPNLSYPLFVPGEGEFAGRYVTNPHFLGAMSRQSFARSKAPGVKRVFILGGSAALGWPGPEESSFAGYIRRALERAAPGEFEIINAAAMSYGSHRIRDLLSDIVALEPDVIILWSGNNEYIEANAFSPLARSPHMAGVQRMLRHSSLYRALRLGLQATVPSLFARRSGEDLTDPRSTPQVRRGMAGRAGESDRKILANYRANLTSMARMIQESGARGIFCTVPVNLSGWAPANVVPELASRSDFERWQALQQQAFSYWDQQRFAEVMPVLGRLLAMTPDYALARYLLGLGYQKQGKLEEARRELDRARDLDPRPMRAMTSFEATIREVAAEHRVRLVDLEGEFLARSGADLSGAEFFIDYVHPTVRGNKLAATLVLDELLRGSRAAQAGATATRLIQEDDWVDRNFDWKADYFYALGMTYQNNGDFGRAEAAYLQVLEADPGMPEAAGNLGAIYEKLGDLNTARRYYEQAVRSDPGTVVAMDLARVLYQQGALAGAREMGRRMVAQGVVNVDLLVLLGEIELAQGRRETARDYFQKAIAAGGDENRLRQRITATAQ